MKKLLLLALLIAVTGGGVGYYLWNKPPEGVARKKADFVVTPEVLLEEFQNNEESANTKYLGKVLQITGKVIELVPGEGAQMQIILDTGDLMSRVSCVLDEMRRESSEVKVSIGDTVKIKGFCTGIAMDIVLDRCVIVE